MTRDPLIRVGDSAGAPPINGLFWFLVMLGTGWLSWMYIGSGEGVASDHPWLLLGFGLLGFWLWIPVAAAADAWARGKWDGWLGWLFPVGLALILLGLYCDLLLFRFMAIHVDDGVRLLFEGGLGQFVLTLEASGVRAGSLWATLGWLFGAVAVLVVLHQATWRLRGTLLLDLSFRRCLAVSVLMAGLLWISQAVAGAGGVGRKVVEESGRLFPLAWVGGSAVGGVGLVTGPFAPFPGVGPGIPAGWKKEAVGEGGGVLLPDLFLIVIESARGDAVESATAPHLSRFARECLAVPAGLASANATHLSWFSLLRSEFPLRFGAVRGDPARWGSPMLRGFKSLGYTLHVIAGTYLNYHLIDRLALGGALELADTYADASAFPAATRPERDRAVMERLSEHMAVGRGGRLFLVFLDSTHHDYYWPADYEAPFQPVVERWDYFDFTVDDAELLRIRNRYRNSVHFVDSLIGRFLGELREQGRDRDAIVVVTGDHGEEFMEHGRMVHASDLWREQIEVPVLIRIPERLRGRLPEGPLPTVSHVDVLPTLWHAVTGEAVSAAADGESLFVKPLDYAVAVDDNGNRDPFRFVVQSGGHKAWLRYRSEGRVAALERRVFLQRMTTREDVTTQDGRDGERLGAAFDALIGDGFRRLYPDYPGFGK